MNKFIYVRWEIGASEGTLSSVAGSAPCFALVTNVDVEVYQSTCGYTVFDIDELSQCFDEAHSALRFAPQLHRGYLGGV